MLLNRDYKIESKRESFIEVCLLILTLFSIFIYLCDLRDVWGLLGVEIEHNLVASTIDIIFVVDLLRKIFFMRTAYIKTVWFYIDLISSLPILSFFAFSSSIIDNLRFARSVRVFRVLRLLKTLKVLSLFKDFKIIDSVTSTSLQWKKYNRTLFFCVLIYTLMFFIIILSITNYNEYVPIFRDSRELEFYFVLGSLLGVLTMVIIARAQLMMTLSGYIKMMLNLVLPPQVVDEFMQNPLSYSKTSREPATVIFCDIKGFTQTVERLGDNLDVLKTHLEKVFEKVVSVHRKYDLIVDKYIGDAVMSFRGGPLVLGTAKEHAYRCVKAAIETYDSVKNIQDPYFSTIRISGASSKSVLVGAFGNKDRLSYTVLGSGVNLASRIEFFINEYGTKNLFCQESYKLTLDYDDICWRKIGSVVVRGQNKPVEVYEALDANVEENKILSKSFSKALELFDLEKYKEAKSVFVDLMDKYSDGPSKYYNSLCKDKENFKE